VWTHARARRSAARLRGRRSHRGRDRRRRPLLLSSYDAAPLRATGDPVTAGGRQVWFTSYDGTLRVVDLASGRVAWSFPASGRLYSSPALLGRTAFFGSMDGTLFAATWPSAEEARP
jgi:hypothetical protein